MSTGRHVVLTAIVLAALGAAADDRVLLPAVARTDGSHGTRWRSDLVVFNPAPEPRTTSVAWFERGSSNPAPRRAELVIPGRGSLLVEDALASLYGVDEGAGGLLFEPDGPIGVSSRTFTTLAGGGTLGQHVPGVPLPALEGVRQDLLLQLTATADFRTNLGFVNLGYDELLAWVVPIAFGAESPKARIIEVPAMGASQHGGILGETDDTVEDGMFWIETGFLSGPFVAWASVVDNLSGDAVFVLPTVPTSEAVYLLGAAHISGYGDTVWRTDLEIVGDPHLAVRLRLEWLAAGSDNTNPAAVEVDLDPGEARRYRDVVAAVFGTTGAGTVRVIPVFGAVMVSARTFTSSTAGTFGQHLPALAGNVATGSRPGEAALAIHLRDTGERATGLRSNLLLQSTSSVAIAVTAEFVDHAGAPLGRLSFELPPFGFRQQNRVLRELRDEGVELAAAILTTATPGGSFLAAVSTIDGVTGDPIFVPAWRQPPPAVRADRPRAGD